MSKFGRFGAYKDFNAMNDAWSRIFKSTGQRNHILCKECGKFHRTQDDYLVCSVAAQRNTTKRAAKKLLSALTGRTFLKRL